MVVDFGKVVHCLLVSLHTPVAQVPLSAEQSVALPAHLPAASQASPVVQNAKSSHSVPTALGFLAHVKVSLPVEVHVPTLQASLDALQFAAAPTVHLPALHKSPAVHPLLSPLHNTPSALATVAHLPVL